MTSSRLYESTLLRRGRRHVVSLPDHDPVIDGMPDALREEVSRTWERRAHEELKVAAAFSVLCREILETRADPSVVSIVSRGVHDEVRHAEVCRALASKYRRAEVPWPPEVTIEPSSTGSDRRLRTVFHLVSMCCMNEVIASAFLQTSLEGAQSPSARTAVGELLADEVEHARAGWIFVATQPPPLRAVIEANLVTLVQPVWRCWWEPGPMTLLEGAPEHGLPSLEATRASAAMALRDIVAPGFAQVGFDVRALMRWLKQLE